MIDPADCEIVSIEAVKGVDGRWEGRITFDLVGCGRPDSWLVVENCASWKQAVTDVLRLQRDFAREGWGLFLDGVSAESETP